MSKMQARMGGKLKAAWLVIERGMAGHGGAVLGGEDLLNFLLRHRGYLQDFLRVLE